MNWFFKSRSKQKISLEDLISCLQVDAHSHLLPAIDDGATNLEDSILLIRGLVELGFKKIITTPHVHPAYYPNTSKKIIAKEAEVKEELKNLQLNTPFSAAAEYYFESKLIEKHHEKNAFLYVQNPYVLIEFDMQQAPHPSWKEIFFELQLRGISIILAHVERYSYQMGKLKWIEDLKNMGVILQLNLGSLIGNYGSPTEKWALKLLNQGLIDVLCTDLHNLNQLKSFQKHLNKVLVLDKQLDPNHFNSLLK